FDAEGSYRDGTVRMSNTDPLIIDAIIRCLARFGFSFVIELPPAGERLRPVKVVRICGGLREHLRFFHTIHAAINRKRDIEGQAVKSSADLRVESLEPLGGCSLLFDITTETGDFIANGVVSHNCYARPTHEYLGFSAGLDFESKILVKEDAPALLRKQLMSKSWKPQSVALSGVTDCYQPIERHLKLTRQRLEVLREFRNPFTTISKNHLVTRDIDIISEMAAIRAAASFVTITSLDADLCGILEPRTSRPSLRLKTIEELSRAGVPVGVMVAPVIPGLTDHEMPAILAEAARAGARFAGYTIVRLPLTVRPLFLEWLETHYPD